MAALFKTLFGFFLLSSSFNRDCDLLPNGHYKIIQIVSVPNSNAANTYKEFQTSLSIDHNNFSQYWDNGESANGRIKWIYDCTFKLEYLNRKTVDTSDLQRLLLRSFGDAIFELKNTTGDTISFRTTYSGNLHVTTSEGYIVKIR
jgi:hypothetical protein